MGMVRGVGVVQGLRPRFFIEHTCNEGVWVGRGGFEHDFVVVHSMGLVHSLALIMVIQFNT